MFVAKVVQTSGICKTNCHNLPFHSVGCSEEMANKAFIFLIFQSFNFNVVALSGRRNGEGNFFPRGFAPGYMQLRFQRALLAIAPVSILQFHSYIFQFLCSCPYRAQKWRYEPGDPGRCPGLIVVALSARLGYSYPLPRSLLRLTVVALSARFACDCACFNFAIPFFNLSIFTFLHFNLRAPRLRLSSFGVVVAACNHSSCGVLAATIALFERSIGRGGAGQEGLEQGLTVEIGDEGLRQTDVLTVGCLVEEGGNLIDCHACMTAADLCYEERQFLMPAGKEDELHH
jgi:hypothetical protein